MKYLLGTLITFIILAVGTYLLLTIWGISIISPANFNKLLMSLGLLLILSLLLTIFTPFFFKNNATAYDERSGNVAQPKK